MQTYLRTYIHICLPEKKHIHIKADRKIDRWTDKFIDRLTDKQIDIDTQTNIYYKSGSLDEKGNEKRVEGQRIKVGKDRKTKSS